MKKYFIAETDEELVFGDTLGLDLTKKTKHGSHTIEGAIKFSELSLPLLLEIGAIEEREVEEEEENTPEDDLLDFGDETPCEELEALEEDFERLEEKVERLETLAVGVCKEMLVLIKELIKENKDGHKEAQPKKKQ